MPRKKADAASADGDAAEPRRSSRIKDLPQKPIEAVKKKVTKPRAKKEGGDAKPKSGKKRKADEEPAVEANGAEKPASKKAKPGSKAGSVKPSSKASAKPASRAGSKKPASKANGAAPPSTTANISETIAEEDEAPAVVAA